MSLQVGNKIDLQENRAIPRETAEQYANENNLLYIETSAKENVLVSDLFELLASRVLERLSASSPTHSWWDTLYWDQRLFFLCGHGPACIVQGIVQLDGISSVPFVKGVANCT